MTTITRDGHAAQLDDEGYLAHWEEWNENVACALAEREGVSEDCPLTQERLEILRFMRSYYRQFNSFPILRAVCKNVHQDRDCTYEQFPDPIAAWRIAGLPKPTTEVFAYIHHGR